MKKYILSPQHNYQLLTRALPYCCALFLILLGIGLWGAYCAPLDYQQKDAFRIIYLHVPAAFLSLMVYAILAFSAALYWIFRAHVWDVLSEASAPIGLIFTFLALVTGSIWGKPMWGTWWVWDARLTSELFLLFIYMGIIALRRAIPDRDQAALISNIFAIIGVIDLPIIHFSVNWWYTLHQGATISRFGKPAMPFEMAWPLYILIGAFLMFYVMTLCYTMRTEWIHRGKILNDNH